MVDLKLEEFRLYNQKEKLEKLSEFISPKKPKTKEILKSRSNQDLKVNVPNNKSTTKKHEISSKVEPQFYLALSPSKNATLKYSKSYRDFVLALNINSTKSFIINKQMWLVLRKHINYIDRELSKPILNVKTAKNAKDGK